MHSHIHTLVCDKGKELKLKVNPSPFRPGEEAAGKRYVSELGTERFGASPTWLQTLAACLSCTALRLQGTCSHIWNVGLGGCCLAYTPLSKASSSPWTPVTQLPAMVHCFPCWWTHCVIHASAHTWLHRWPYTSWKGEPHGSWGVSQPSGVLKAWCLINNSFGLMELHKRKYIELSSSMPVTGDPLSTPGKESGSAGLNKISLCTPPNKRSTD